MKLKNNYLFVCLLTIFALLISTPQVMAGAGIDDTAAVRFKRVVDCNVETQAIVDTGWALECPPDAAGATGHTLPEGTIVFGKATPYITKVKNFKKEGNIVSFDAQFKYWHR